MQLSDWNVAISNQWSCICTVEIVYNENLCVFSHAVQTLYCRLLYFLSEKHQWNVYLNRFYMPHGITTDMDDNYWVTDVALHQVKTLKWMQETCVKIKNLWRNQVKFRTVLEGGRNAFIRRAPIRYSVSVSLRYWPFLLDRGIGLTRPIQIRYSA